MGESVKPTTTVETPIYTALESWIGQSPIHSDRDLAEMIEHRLPTDMVDRMIDHGLEPGEIHRLVLPRRTLDHRRAKGEALTLEESDRAVRVSRIVVQAEQAFGNQEKALRWLRKPKRRFSGRSPLDMLTTEAGARHIEELLLQLEHGMAA